MLANPDIPEAFEKSWGTITKGKIPRLKATVAMVQQLGARLPRTPSILWLKLWKPSLAQITVATTSTYMLLSCISRVTSSAFPHVQTTGVTKKWCGMGTMTGHAKIATSSFQHGIIGKNFLMDDLPFWQ